jgi:hypothetical protein
MIAITMTAMRMTSPLPMTIPGAPFCQTGR